MQNDIFTNLFFRFLLQDESHLPHISIAWDRNSYAMEYDHYCQRGKYVFVFQMKLTSRFKYCARIPKRNIIIFISIYKKEIVLVDKIVSYITII